MSHALFQALETSEMLMISEYSYEMTFNTKFKNQDYDYFYEMVGASEHIDKVINLHRVYLSLLLSMEHELQVMTDDLAVLSRLNSLIGKVKEKVGQDDRVIQELMIGEQWLD